MTALDDEKSPISSRPLELFKLIGNYNTYRLTSNKTDVNITEGDYLAVPMEREAAKIGTEKDTISLNLSLPMDHPVVQEYALQTAPPKLTLEYYRAHRNNPEDTILVWTGEVTSWSVEGRTAKLTVPSMFNYLLEGATPPPKYQLSCNHELYDARCRVSEADFSQDAIIQQINGREITVDTLNVFTSGEAVGGTITVLGSPQIIIQHTYDVRFYVGVQDPNAFGTVAVVEANGKTLAQKIVDVNGDGSYHLASARKLDFDQALGGQLIIGAERRMVTAQDNETLTVASEFSSHIQVGDPCTLTAGCDHDGETCREKFDNWDNFFGFPFVPNGNPFIRRIT